MSRLRAVLVGAGKIGAGYADDAAMSRHYRFATHAQVLAEHPRYEWVGLVEPDRARRETAAARWKIPFAAATADEVSREVRPDVCVLAVGPDGRSAALQAFPTLRGVLVEKPLGRTPGEGEAFAAACSRRGLRVQVNLHRRVDTMTRALAQGGLVETIGRTQGAFLTYGNGLRNNGTHMIDLARKLLGEVSVVRALSPPRSLRAPDPTDMHVSFLLEHHGGTLTHAMPLDFAAFRENSLDIWGVGGRLALWQEGLVAHHYPRAPNRAMSGEHEVTSDSPKVVATTIGEAYYQVYDDLARAMTTGTAVASPPENALVNARLIEAILDSASRGGERIQMEAQPQ